MHNHLKIIGNILILATLFTGPSALGADHKCTDCHKSNTPGATDLIRPPSRLCADCHAARIAAGEHAVNIPLALPGDTSNMTLPLQNGMLTCITCHDPHKTGLALRLIDPDLCRQCHIR